MQRNATQRFDLIDGSNIEDDDDDDDEWMDGWFFYSMTMVLRFIPFVSRYGIQSRFVTPID